MSTNITHAMILAAGLGTRMRPLTLTTPKPLIPVADKALIDWNLDWLAQANVENVVINSSYLAEQLEAHLATRTTPHITLSREGQPALETGGGVALALPHLGTTPFLTMNSDAILLDNNKHPHPIMQLADAWSDDVDFLMLLVPRNRAHGWSGNGDFILREDGAIRRPLPNEDAEMIFTGVELMHPHVFEGCPSGAFSLSQVWKQRIGEGRWYQRIRAVVYAGEWLNVGDLQGLEIAQTFLSTTKTSE